MSIWCSPELGFYHGCDGEEAPGLITRSLPPSFSSLFFFLPLLQLASPSPTRHLPSRCFPATFYCQSGVVSHETVSNLEQAAKPPSL